MFCRNCGAEIPDGVYFCEKCGAKTEEQQNIYAGEFYENAPADYTEPLNTTKWIIPGVLSAFFAVCLAEL